MEIPQELDRLLEAQEMETAVHERAHAFLDERIVHLQDQKDVWAKERHGKHMEMLESWKVEGCRGKIWEQTVASFKMNVNIYIYYIHNIVVHNCGD